jgi:hypothetical protein
MQSDTQDIELPWLLDKLASAATLGAVSLQAVEFFDRAIALRCAQVGQVMSYQSN